ncbi:MAG: class II aldolase/adducin family protein [Spirochaetales bacterium]|nr:class II aldolase/adducin family protein [Spirochaetales bacterium]
MIYQQERADVAAYMRRLYERHLTTCSGGNISLRTGDGHILITASSIDKASLQAEHIAVLSPEGENLTGELRTSIETGMHLAVYRERTDVKAVIHAHPVHGSLFTASEHRIRTDLLAESRYMLGEPAFAPYALMGTEDLALIMGETFRDSAVLSALMENHGLITVGDTLHLAYDRMEVLEASARMTWMGILMGGVRGLTPERCREVDALHG